MRRKKVKISLGVFLLLGICAYFYRFLAVWGVPFHALRHGNLSHSYAWIWKCSLWEYDLNTSEYVEELLLENRQDAFFFRPILLDSPWSTPYN